MTEQAKLKEQIRERLNELKDETFAPEASAKARSYINKFGEKRELKGHFQKVYSVHWAGRGSDLFLSASQDGKLIVWNAESTNKLNAISLEDNWVMTCAFEQSENQLVATGGLKNICYIYQQTDYEPGEHVRPQAELTGHEGYISCCRFLNSSRIVTSSGDGSCRLWDINKNVATHMFKGHMQDVMSISPNPDNENIFVSGSIDLDCKLWDIREKGTIGTFTSAPAKNAFDWNDEPEFNGEIVGAKMLYTEHESDINSVAFYPDGFAFGSGSDDMTCKLWDTRTHQEVNVFRNNTMVTGVNSIDFSKSGRIMFAGYDDSQLLGWDTLKNPNESGEAEPVISLRRHQLKVSSVSVHSAGKAVATASWDTLIKIYA